MNAQDKLFDAMKKDVRRKTHIIDVIVALCPIAFVDIRTAAACGKLLGANREEVVEALSFILLAQVDN